MGHQKGDARAGPSPSVALERAERLRYPCNLSALVRRVDI